MTTALVILSVHAAATAMMAGLIWFVQIVHYPLMAAVPADDFVSYEHQHVKRTGWIVGPLMLAELASAAALVFVARSGLPSILAWIGIALLVLIWLSTLTLQVPCHRRLEQSYSATIVRRLVTTNWIRTIAWSFRAVIALVLLGSEPLS